MRNQHDRRGTPGRRFGERVLQPHDVRVIARGEFRGVRSGIAEVIARSGDVERGVGDAADGPPAILDTRHQAVDASTEGRRLDLLPPAVPAEGEGCGEKQVSLVLQTLERREPAVGRPVAIGPIVVARCEHRRRFQRIEVAERLHVHRIAARGRRDRAGDAAAHFEIAVVHGELEVLPVHVSDACREGKLSGWRFRPDSVHSAQMFGKMDGNGPMTPVIDRLFHRFCGKTDGPLGYLPSGDHCDLRTLGILADRFDPDQCDWRRRVEPVSPERSLLRRRDPVRRIATNGMDRRNKPPP